METVSNPRILVGGPCVNRSCVLISRARGAAYQIKVALSEGRVPKEDAPFAQCTGQYLFEIAGRLSCEAEPSVDIMDRLDSLIDCVEEKLGEDR